MKRDAERSEGVLEALKQFDAAYAALQIAQRKYIEDGDEDAIEAARSVEREAWKTLGEAEAAEAAEALSRRSLIARGAGGKGIGIMDTDHVAEKCAEAWKKITAFKCGFGSISDVEDAIIGATHAAETVVQLQRLRREDATRDRADAAVARLIEDEGDKRVL